MATMVTNELSGEFFILAKSLELTGNTAPLFVLTDTPTAELIKNEFPGMDIRVNVGLDEFSSRNRMGMVNDKVWNEFMLKKTNVIRKALHQFRNTLFVDSDIIFFNPISGIDLQDKVAALSPHHIVKKDEIRYGKYNAGYLAVSDPAFLDWWIDATYSHSKYFEQECFTRAHRFHPVSEIPIQHNYGWWRLHLSGEKDKRTQKFTTGAAGLEYDGQPLVSVHTHILSEYPLFVPYNRFILRLLRKSGLPRHRALYRYILQKRK